MANFDALKASIQKLVPEYELSLAVLFGSQARGETHAKSDIDIAVQGNAGPVDFLKLVEIANRLSKAAKTDHIDVVDITKMSPLLRKQVADDGVILFERHNNIFAEFMLLANKLYIEAKPLLLQREQYVKQALGLASA